MQVNHERKKLLPELFEIERLIDKLSNWARVETLTEVSCAGLGLPVYALSFGPDKSDTPVLGIFAGVHGLEKIGTQLAIAYLKTLAELLSWDSLIHDFLRQARLLFVPLVNPGGMLLRRRANPNGVDLMRNAPVEAEDLAKFQLLSGHRLSPRLPWYRGAEGEAMQAEAAAICEFVKRSCFAASVALTLDIHSGFGVRDRLWFPYAKSKKPIAHLPEIYSLIELFEQTYPNNVYKIEPQSQSYTTHGDLWDFLYDDYQVCGAPGGLFLPFCLELGSWLWVKKNPKQLFSVVGAFNPMVLHRKQRTMRRHLVLFDFLQRAVLANGVWAKPDSKTRRRLNRQAMAEWYGRRSALK